MKALITLLALVPVLVGCGDANNPQSIIKLSVTERSEVRAALGDPIQEQGNLEGYTKYCKTQQRCYQGYNRVELDAIKTSTPKIPIKCADVCLCIIQYDSQGKVNSCTGCVEELCKI